MSSFVEQSFRFDHMRINWNEQVSFYAQATRQLACIITDNGIRRMGECVETFFREDIVFITPYIPHCRLFDNSDFNQNVKIENLIIRFSNRFFWKIVNILFQN